MLPSLQESLDGDEKELESSEEGGSAEERRLEPPPSSHYCLYSYRGSRCSARPPLWPRPGPAAHPRVPQAGGSQTPSSPLPAEVSGPQGPSRPKPYFLAWTFVLALPCLCPVLVISAPSCRPCLLFSAVPRTLNNVNFHPMSFLSLSPPFIPTPHILVPTSTFW